MPTDAPERDGLIRAVIESLIDERRDLGRRGIDGPALEANRLAIAYWQQALLENEIRLRAALAA